MFQQALIRALLCSIFLVGGPVHAWVEEVRDEMASSAIDPRCVGFVPLNDLVFVLTAPSSEGVLSPWETKKALRDLTTALETQPGFRITHRSALPNEAARLSPDQAGSREFSETLSRVTNAAITVVFTPETRRHDSVEAIVTMLFRRNDDGDPILACTEIIPVIIPLDRENGGHEQTAAAAPSNGFEYRYRLMDAQITTAVHSQRLRSIGGLLDSRRRICDQDALCIQSAEKDAEMALDQLEAVISEPAFFDSDGCQIMSPQFHNDPSSAIGFVRLYFEDLARQDVPCAKKRWGIERTTLAEMVLRYRDAILVGPQLVYGNSPDTVFVQGSTLNIEVKDGRRNREYWENLEFTLRTSSSGWKIFGLTGDLAWASAW